MERSVVHGTFSLRGRAALGRNAWFGGANRDYGERRLPWSEGPEVGGRCRAELHPFSEDGVEEAERGGVKGVAPFVFQMARAW